MMTMPGGAQSERATQSGSTLRSARDRDVQDASPLTLEEVDRLHAVYVEILSWRSIGS